MSLKTSRSLPLLFLYFLRMSSYRLHNTHVALCPHDNSIEGLVEFCSDVITFTYNVIDDVTIDQLRDEQRIVNSTCAMYMKRTSCYNRLLLHCQPDSRVSSDVGMILDRLSIYSRTCVRDAHEGVQMMLCYGRFSRQIKTCSQAHDAYYPFYVIEHQSRSACRVLNSAINCLLQIEREMLDACSNPLWSSDFHTAYIRPLVHRSYNSSYRLQCPISSHLRDIHLSPLSLSTATRSGINLLTKLTAATIIIIIIIITQYDVVN